MTVFSALPNVCQTVLVTLMFTALTGELLLLAYKIRHAAPLRRCIRTGVTATIDFLLLILLRPYLPRKGPPSAVASFLPWSIVAGVIMLTILHLVYSFPKEKKCWNNCLTPQSVYEATNNLPMGVCFSNSYGRVILCNRTMRSLANQLLGSYPQMMAELTDALKAPPEKTELLPDGRLQFENGRIYQFCLSTIPACGNHA